MDNYCEILLPNKFTLEQINMLNNLFTSMHKRTLTICYKLDEVSFEFVKQSLEFNYHVYYFILYDDGIHYKMIGNNYGDHFSASAIGSVFIYACNTCASEIGYLNKAYISVLQDKWRLCYICYKQHEKEVMNVTYGSPETILLKN